MPYDGREKFNWSGVLRLTEKYCTYISLLTVLFKIRLIPDVLPKLSVPGQFLQVLHNVIEQF